MSGAVKTMVSDVDDVLVHIATPWVERARLLPLFSQTLARLPAGEALREMVIGRPWPYVQDWLTRVHGLPEQHIEQFNAVYTDDPHFYDDLPPTRFCETITAMLDNPVERLQLHLVTHSFKTDDAATASKRRWIERQFGRFGGRVVAHYLHHSQKKSQVIREVCREPEAFADDTMKNVVDVLLADDVRPHEILIPQMGHNNIHPDIHNLARLRRIRMVRFEEG